MKPISEKVLQSIKGWMKKAADYTKEEGKVLAIRAKEAGKLTALNAKKHKLYREYQDACAQLGQQMIGSSKVRENNPYKEPKIKELTEKAEHLQKEIKKVEEEIEFFKKECNEQVSKTHQKEAA
ncbi:MAG: hypothetical protein HYY62_04750 [Deltaproteobacteria bacterium]|nr:hypothetical protein [Deltaproteobacteria bacterium]